MEEPAPTPAATASDTPSVDPQDTAATPTPEATDAHANPYPAAPEGCTIITLGTYSSLVKTAEGEQLEVASSTLLQDRTAGSKTPLRMAYIGKTYSGKVAVRKAPKVTATTLKKITDGRLMLVLGVENSFAHVVINGKLEGYVQAILLKYVDMNTQPIGTGILALNGKTNGKAVINIRIAPSLDARRVADLKTGTVVTIWGESGKFYEVEADGCHGYVRKNYCKVIEMQEDTP